MKPSQQLKLSVLSALSLAVALTFRTCSNQVVLVEASRITEHHQYDSQLPQTDPELDLTSLKQRVQQQIGVFMKEVANNEPDGQFTRQQQAPASLATIFRRHQRSVNYNQQPQQQRVQYPLQLANHQLFEDENALKRQLPDLIAQAHNDKNVERALLRMLFNASLRSNLNSVASSRQSAGAYNNNGRLVGDGWQSDTIGDGGSSSSYAPMSRMAFGRFDQTVFDGGNSASNGIDPFVSGTNDMLVRSYAGQQDSSAYQSPLVDKREYIKPCSFNAVSCAKNPFRRF